jgi:uncharacterized protein YbgA (DUF1722 family)/uncharacterized protein YbbK (DUF523 family)
MEIVVTNTATPACPPIRIGISACLLGQRVRFDGGHKHDHFLTETFGKYVEWVPVCPEVELGMGTPREPIRLVQITGDTSARARDVERSPLGPDNAASVRLVGVKSGADHTDAMRRYARRRAAALASEGLSGYVLKKDSPSCGMERVKVYHGDRATRSGRGLFAEVLLERFPNLPIEEEGRLCDPRLRENWIERVFAYHRLQQLWRPRWTLGDLVAFHTAQKLSVLAHAPQAYQQLGRLVARGKSLDRSALRGRYERELMSALSVLATRGRHANVLQHILGYFKKALDEASRRELLTHIEDYRRGHVPLVVPLTLIAHYVRRFGIEYLQRQAYLQPHPKELALRNHV